MPICNNCQTYNEHGACGCGFCSKCGWRVSCYTGTYAPPIDWSKVPLITDGVIPPHEDIAKLANVKKLVEDWIGKQGHDSCWYYPTIFAQICAELGIEWKEPTLPSRQEFEKGCCEFQKELYGSSTKST